MRRYETFIILDPDLSEEGRAPAIDKIKEVITEHGGFLVLVDDWGNRKLAYEIKKKARGYYVRIDFCGDATLVNEMERFFRITDGVMKFMTVLLDKEVDLEKVKEEAAALEAQKNRPQETTEVTPSEPEAAPVAESETTEVEADTPDGADSEPTPEQPQEQIPEETEEEKK